MPETGVRFLFILLDVYPDGNGALDFANQLADAVRIGITGDHAFKGGFLIAQAIDVRTPKQKGWCQPGTQIEW